MPAFQRLTRQASKKRGFCPAKPRLSAKTEKSARFCNWLCDNILITWDSVADAEGYYLLRIEDFTDESTMILFECTSNSYVDETAVPGKKYYYAVASFYGVEMSETVGISLGLRMVSLILPSSTQSVATQGGEQSFAVKANTSWKATTTAEWITLSSTTGTGDGNITYAVSANAAESVRTGYIMIVAGEGTDCPLSQQVVVEQAAATIQKPLTLANALGVDGYEITTTGDAVWFAQEDTTAEGGMSARSGSIGIEEESSMSFSVSGSGTLTFKWKGDCEADPRGRYSYDRGSFYVDDEIKCQIDGDTEWQLITVTIQGDGSHILNWTYTKDDYDEDDYEGGDCIWVDSVVWTPVGGEPIPALPDNPTAADVAEALAGAADAGLGKNITTPEKYNAFRDWAGKVKVVGSGTVAGLQAVQDSPHAWLSYALGSATLIEKTPAADDISVEAFTPAAESGKFDFTVSVDGVTVGSDALKENLKQVFGLEGSMTLNGNDFSSSKVDITFGTPENGKVKFTAGPNSANAGAESFFMKIKVMP